MADKKVQVYVDKDEYYPWFTVMPATAKMRNTYPDRITKLDLDLVRRYNECQSSFLQVTDELEKVLMEAADG